jgi:hypothetical protein
LVAAFVLQKAKPRFVEVWNKLVMLPAMHFYHGFAVCQEEIRIQTLGAWQ